MKYISFSQNSHPGIVIRQVDEAIIENVTILENSNSAIAINGKLNIYLLTKVWIRLLTMLIWYKP